MLCQYFWAVGWKALEHRAPYTKVLWSRKAFLLVTSSWVKSQAVCVVTWIPQVSRDTRKPCWHYLLDLEVRAGGEWLLVSISSKTNSKKPSSWLKIIQENGIARTHNIYPSVVFSWNFQKFEAYMCTQHQCTGLPARCFLLIGPSTSVWQCILKSQLSSLTPTWFGKTLVLLRKGYLWQLGMEWTVWNKQFTLAVGMYQCWHNARNFPRIHGVLMSFTEYEGCPETCGQLFHNVLFLTLLGTQNNLIGKTS